MQVIKDNNQEARITLIGALTRWLTVVIWMIVIYYFSDQPNSAATTQQYFGDANLIARKIAHISEFAILTLLLNWSISYSEARQSKGFWFISLLLSLCYAIFDEWHQEYVPGRSASVFDVLIDSSGILFAIFVLYLGRDRKKA